MKNPKGEINNLAQLTGDEGKVRGVVFETDKRYILREKGKGILAQVEVELKMMGYPIKYSQIKTMDFYPFKLRVASLLAIKKVCGFSDEKIKEMGFQAPKFSLVVKLFIKYFSSVPTAIQKAPALWKKHYTTGKLSVIELDEEARKIVLRIEDTSLHPLICQYLVGYLASVTQMIIGVPILMKETKCTSLGEKYHEYSGTWQ